MIEQVRVIDSHTGGEPTRVVVAGGPDLLGGSVAQQLRVFREKHEAFRSAVVNEPRGSDVMVGAMLVPPGDRQCASGVIFFNNVGCLGMCGHGTIGVVATLRYLGVMKPGEHRIETPVGVVTARLHEDETVSVQNVPSYRLAKGVKVNVDRREVNGDVAWGGNWFFLVEDHGQDLDLKNVERLTDFSWRVRRALEWQGVTGRDGAEIDHIELFDGHRNFVLCPGGA